MAGKHLTSNDANTTPAFILDAIGVRRDWMENRLCRRPGEESRRQPPYWWTVGRNEWIHLNGKRVYGRSFIESALAICVACPVQWDCIGFGVETRAQAGTWGVDFDDLVWFARQPDWEKLLTMWRTLNVPVNDAVVRLRRNREPVEQPVAVRGCKSSA